MIQIQSPVSRSSLLVLPVSESSQSLYYTSHHGGFLTVTALHLPHHILRLISLRKLYFLHLSISLFHNSYMLSKNINRNN